ncbi:hypothetical protein L6452_42440 [Arctium lappa]|uniref:Uncharacterized protein n=1 Tax=Arctium lappa TaxID=4217 RepID=A0ACB8XI94_ARCLA|nr:hypothetical protein L6452_42440 [Arctium lappa]
MMLQLLVHSAIKFFIRFLFFVNKHSIEEERNKEITGSWPVDEKSKMRLRKCLIGKVNSLDNIESIQNMCNLENNGECTLKYLGGRNVMLTFDQEESVKMILNNKDHGLQFLISDLRSTILEYGRVQVATPIRLRIDELRSIKVGPLFYRIWVTEEETVQSAYWENVDPSSEEEMDESSVPSEWTEEGDDDEEWCAVKERNGDNVVGVNEIGESVAGKGVGQNSINEPTLREEDRESQGANLNCRRYEEPIDCFTNVDGGCLFRREEKWKSRGARDLSATEEDLGYGNSVQGPSKKLGPSIDSHKTAQHVEANNSTNLMRSRNRRKRKWA